MLAPFTHRETGAGRDLILDFLKPWTTLKVFIVSVIISSLFYVLVFSGHEARGILAHQPGAELYALRWTPLDHQGSPTKRLNNVYS